MEEDLKGKCEELKVMYKTVGVKCKRANDASQENYDQLVDLWLKEVQATLDYVGKSNQLVEKKAKSLWVNKSEDNAGMRVRVRVNDLVDKGKIISSVYFELKVIYKAVQEKCKRANDAGQEIDDQQVGLWLKEVQKTLDYVVENKAMSWWVKKSEVNDIRVHVNDLVVKGKIILSVYFELKVIYRAVQEKCKRANDAGQEVFYDKQVNLWVEEAQKTIDYVGKSNLLVEKKATSWWVKKSEVNDIHVHVNDLVVNGEIISSVYFELKVIYRTVLEKCKRAKDAGQEVFYNEQVNLWLEEAHNTLDYIGKLINLPVGEKEKSSLVKKPEGISSVNDISLFVKDLVDKGKNISSVYFSTETQGIDDLWHGNFIEFKSRKEFFDEIMEGLKSEEAGTIGIVGMGGMGKTKLVIELGKKAKEANLFSEVVMVTVSMWPDIIKIQGTLADMLKLRLNNYSGVDDRSNKLREKLKRGNFLVILDDVWEKIDTKRIGIPEHEGCRILLTTRREEVCKSMCCGLTKNIGPIEDIEAFELFKSCAVLKSTHKFCYNTAKKIVYECGGLPLGIVTVGRALRNKGEEEYKCALGSLSKSNFVDIDIGPTDKGIYKCLKVSYDYLEERETQKCFLLCAFFRENAYIDVEELTRYVYGLCLLGDVESVDEVKQRVILSLRKLVNASLLHFVERVADIDNPFAFISLHDIVRDVALWIGRSHSEGSFVVGYSLKECQRNYISEKVTAIYLQPQDLKKYRPQELKFPNLKMLIICMDCTMETLPGDFFKNAKSLQVLTKSMEIGFKGEHRHKILTPDSVKDLDNLKVLHLNRIILSTVNEMSIICKLKSLEILLVTFPTEEKVLPEYIGELCNLRVLDLSECKELELIPCNLLSKLTKLEELYTPLGHTAGWSDAFLFDLKYLPRLSVFTGCFVRSNRWNIDQSGYRKRDRVLVLHELNDESMKILEPICPGVQYLDLGMKLMHGIKNLCPQLDHKGFPNLRQLRLADSKSLECLVDATTEKGQGLCSLATAQVLCNLVELDLKNMEQLCMICYSPFPLMDFLGSLRYASIRACPRIEFLVPAPRLKLLFISSCRALKSLYHQENPRFMHVGYANADLHTMTTLEAMLISLTEVRIRDCENIEEVFPKFQALESNNQQCKRKLLTNLAVFVLEVLPELKCIWKAPVQNYCLNKLKKVMLHKCDKLFSVFTPVLAQSLKKLEVLDIRKCAVLETIISQDKQDGLYSSTSGMNFQNIKIVIVDSCPKLKAVLPMAFVAKDLPNLESIKITNCEALEEVFSIGPQIKAYSQNMSRDIIVMKNLKELDLVHLPKLKLTSLISLIIGGTTFSEVELAEEPYEIKTRYLRRSNGSLQLQIGEETIDIPVHDALHDTAFLFPRQCKEELIDVGYCDADLHTKITLKAMLISLNIVDICHYESLEEIFTVSESSNQHLNRILLTNLAELYLSGLPKLKHIWKVPVQNYCLLKLKKFELHKCDNLSTIFTPVLAQSLLKLEHLKIRECAMLETIISQDKQDKLHSSTVGMAFQEIRSVMVDSCPNLRTVLPMSFVTKGLPKLEYLKIINCAMLEKIISLDKQDELVSFTLGMSFQEVTSVMVDSCPNLRAVMPMSFVTKGLPKLESLKIINCAILETIFSRDKEDELSPSTSPMTFQEVRSVMVESCPKLKTVLPFAFVAKGLPKLKSLKIKECEMLETIISQNKQGELQFATSGTSSQEICSMTVESCPKLKTVLPIAFVAKGLPKLLDISLRSCCALEEVFCFGQEIKADCQDMSWDVIVVKHLDLEDLPKLKLTPLVSLAIGETTSKQASGVRLAEVQDRDTKSYFSSVQQPFLLKVDILLLNNMPKLHYLWRGPTEFIKFGSLWMIDLNYCPAIKSLFTYSISCALHSLYSLKLRNCNTLKNIIETDPDEHSFCNMFLPKLQHLFVHNCEVLEYLFPVFGIPVLQSLKNLNIIDCPKLENIFHIEMEHEECSWSCSESATDEDCSRSFQENFSVLVKSCPKLKTVLPMAFVTKGLPKPEYIKIINCEALEQVFRTGQQNKAAVQDMSRDITVAYPVSLKLCGSMPKQDSDVEVTGLQEDITNTILSIRESESFRYMEVACEDAQQSILFLELQCLELGNMLRVPYLTEFISPCNLKIIEANTFPGIINLFTHSISCTLVSLEIVRVYNCTMLKNIIENDHEEHSLCSQCFPSLRFLHLVDCPKLENIFDVEMEREECSRTSSEFVTDEDCSANFQEIRLVKVESCPKLKTVLPMAFFIKGLPKLERISIIRCEALEEVFGNGQKNKLANQDMSQGITVTYPISLKIGGTVSKQDSDVKVTDGQEEITHSILRGAKSLSCMEVDCEDTQQSILFSGLQCIKLGNMLRLEHLSAEFIISPYNLKIIEANNCPAIKSLFTHSISCTLGSLEILRVYNCAMLKNIVESDHEEHSLCNRCFPSLRFLEVVDCPKLEHIFHIEMEHKECSWCYSDSASDEGCSWSFPEIRWVKVELCPILKTVLPMGFFIKGMSKLESISIIKCEALDKVFGTGQQNKVAGQDMNREITVNYPVSLKIGGTVSKHDSDVDVTGVQEEVNTRILSIRRAESLRCMEVDCEDAQPPILFSELQCLELGNMLKLHHLLTEFISPCNLKIIETSNCPAIKGLFTHNISCALGALEILRVFNCTMLKNIIESDPEEHSLCNRCFPSLRFLQVVDCPKLESIFHFGMELEECSRSSSEPATDEECCWLPSLKAIQVEGCDELRTIFSLSVTPLLPRLNTITVKRSCRLQQIFGKYQEEKRARYKYIWLPELNVLHLEELPCFYQTCPEDCILITDPSFKLEFGEGDIHLGRYCYGLRRLRSFGVVPLFHFVFFSFFVFFWLRFWGIISEAFNV